MNVKPLLWFSLGLSLVLAGCIFEKEANRGSVVDNELRVGKLFLADGRPAVNARVRVFPVTHVPDSSSPVFSTRTDAKGNYVVDSLSSDEYNILGDLDGELSFQDSVFISASTKVIPADTLDDPGSVTGVVGLQPGDDPRTVTVQVLGTNRFSNVDVSGRFRLAGLGAGKYAIRVLTTLSEYTPLFSGLTARAGRSDTLRDTLWIQYTGIPAVTGIKAVMDTVNGVARITWNPVDFPSFGGYSVYRDPVGTLDFAKAPINTLRLTDTVFLDTLYRLSGDTLPRNWEYRVNVQNLNGKPGKVFNVAVLAAVPPKTAQTRFRFKLLGTHGDTASIRDTVKVIAVFENPAYANQRIAWTEAGMADTLRTAKPEVKSGADTLTWIAPDSAGVRTIRVQATDAAGRIWRDSLRLNTELDRPLADAGRDTLVSYGTSFTLNGKAKDGFGAIVKWEWRVGESPDFNRTGSGDTTFILPQIPDTTFLCILRVTDEDGLIGLDTMLLKIIPSRNVGRLVTPQLKNNLIIDAFPQGGRIVSVLDDNGTVTLESFDTVSGKSTVLSSRKLQGNYRAGAIVEGKLYLMGSFLADDNLNHMDTYDFETGSWGTEPSWVNQDSSLPRPDLKVIGFGGKLFAFTDHGFIFEYDPSAKKWSKRLDMQSFGDDAMALCIGDGKIYAYKYLTFGVFDPAENTWKVLPRQENRARPGMAWVGGKVLIFGGGKEDGPNSSSRVDEFDPVTNAWKPYFPMFHPTIHPGVAVLGDKIYIVGASSFVAGQPSTVELDFIEAYKP